MGRRDNFTPCENSIRLDKKVAVVTGSTSGVGLEAAKELAKRGARVSITGRDPDKLVKARNQIENVTGNRNIVGKQVDFESLRSIRNFVNEMYIQETKLNILINNVGAIALGDRLTEDNLHVMMQVNYFGAFLLTFLLFPLLEMSAPSRVINVSSFAQFAGQIHLDHMNDVGRYSGGFLYTNAKLADVLFTVEMNRRTTGRGVAVFSLDPGLIQSEIFKNFKSSVVRSIANSTLHLLGEPGHRVATTYVWLATDAKVVNSSGKHFKHCKEYYASILARDAQLTRNLWNVSKKLVKIQKDEDWESRGL